MSRSSPAVAPQRTTVPVAAPEPRPRPSSRARARLRLSYPAGLIAAVAATLIVLVGNTAARGPATGAARIVPRDALAYIHVSIDPGRPAVKQALALAARFPDYGLVAAAVRERLAAITGHAGVLDFARDVKPWLGSEAALALLNTPGQTADGLIVLAVGDRVHARAMLARSGARYSQTYRGVRVLGLSSATMLALVRGYLVIGTGSGVRGAIDAAYGDGASLASSPDYQHAAADEPADRVLDAYVSAAGVRRLLVPWGGALGALGTLLSRPALTGIAISLSPAPHGARVHVHSALDPAVAGPGGPPPARFTPTLQRVIPSGSMMMLDLAGLDQGASHLLSAAAAGGVAAKIGPLLSRLGAALSSEGVNVHSILSIFHGETAVAIGPAGAGAPSLILAARVRDPAAARAELASAETPLAQLFQPSGSGGGQAPLLNDRQFGNATIHELELGPGLQLDYTVSNRLVVIATSLTGVTSVLEHSHTLPSDAAYRATVSNRPQGTTSLVFLDLRQLLSLGEQTGLMRSARYHALRPDLEKVRAVSLESTSGETDSTAELFLQIP